jgi:ubiquinone/menaquinone biosynthesis C-methylase UbiE
VILTAIDPSEDMWKKCTIDIRKLGFHFKFIIASAEELPLMIIVLTL